MLETNLFFFPHIGGEGANWLFFPIIQGSLHPCCKNDRFSDDSRYTHIYGGLESQAFI